MSDSAFRPLAALAIMSLVTACSEGVVSPELERSTSWSSTTNAAFQQPLVIFVITQGLYYNAFVLEDPIGVPVANPIGTPIGTPTGTPIAPTGTPIGTPIGTPLEDPLRNLEETQLLSNGRTEFGPGQLGYLGGRWWEDRNNNLIRDSADHFFFAPLQPPGRIVR